MSNIPDRWMLVNPVIFPITVDDLKEHMRRNDNAEDAKLLKQIKVASKMVEDFLQVSFLTQQFRLIYDGFGTCGERKLKLRFPPFQTIEQVGYIDIYGETQVLATTEYRYDLKRRPAYIRPGWEKTLPAARNVEGNWFVDVTAGVTTAGALDPRIPEAVCLVASELFQRRSISALRDLSRETLDVLNIMLDSHRLVSF